MQALACGTYTLPLLTPTPQLAADTLWAPAGHEVQTVQLALAGLLPPQPAPSSSGGGAQQAATAAPPAVQQDAAGVTVSGGGGWELRFDAASGGLASWTAAGGRRVLAAPLAPCFYRAPTDNDKGGSGGSSYAARWGSWRARGSSALPACCGCALCSRAARRAPPSLATLSCLLRRAPPAHSAGGRLQGWTGSRWSPAAPASA